MTLTDLIKAAFEAVGADIKLLRTRLDSGHLGVAGFPELESDPDLPKSGDAWIKVTPPTNGGQLDGFFGAMPFLEASTPIKQELRIKTAAGVLSFFPETEDVRSIPEIIGDGATDESIYVRVTEATPGGVFGGLYGSFPALSIGTPELAALTVKSSSGRVYTTQLQG